eukprot:7683120-Lingulodinium_polyedra.AAC.1
MAWLSQCFVGARFANRTFARSMRAPKMVCAWSARARGSRVVAPEKYRFDRIIVQRFVNVAQ